MTKLVASATVIIDNIDSVVVNSEVLGDNIVLSEHFQCGPLGGGYQSCCFQLLTDIANKIRVVMRSGRYLVVGQYLLCEVLRSAFLGIKEELSLEFFRIDLFREFLLEACGGCRQQHVRERHKHMSLS